MKVTRLDQVEQTYVKMEGAVGAYIRILISEEDGAPNFIMREFELEPDGHTPYHNHDFEHEIYVLSGEGVLANEDEEHPLFPGTVAFVAPNEMHNFINVGVEPFRFLCMVPK